MSDLVNPAQIEDIVGLIRHPWGHYGRAVSAEQRVYILHSQECLDREDDLRECYFSQALDRGVDLERWGVLLDQPVHLVIEQGRLMPIRDRYVEQPQAQGGLDGLDAHLEQLAAGEASDGHHTHNELYRYRMLYHALAAAEWARHGTYPVVKSWHHSDGELCFGGGWFIVVATLPTGQVSNHYRAQHWDLFDVPEADLPPEYDGHTPAQAADRMQQAALLPEEVQQLRSRRALGEEQCCLDCCEGGACETCLGCAAGWCVNGHDFVADPDVWGQMMSEEDHQRWWDVARDHNPGIHAALVRAEDAEARARRAEDALRRMTATARCVLGDNRIESDADLGNYPDPNLAELWLDVKHADRALAGQTSDATRERRG